LAQRRTEADVLSRVALTVFEPSDELGTGVTYGPKSGDRTLTITPMREVLPSGVLGDFGAWLTRSPERGLLGETSGAEVDPVGARYLPRRVVGRFLKERVARAVAALGKMGVAVEHRRKAILKVRPAAGGVRVFDGAAYAEFDAVVLMNGTPKSPHGSGLADSLQASDHYISDLYSPGIDQNVNRILSRCRRAGGTTVVAIGTNASSVEAGYLLADAIQSGLVRFHAVSASGRWPAILGAKCRPPFGVSDVAQPTSGMALRRRPLLTQDERVRSVHACLARGDLDAALEVYRSIATALDGASHQARDDAINFVLPAVVDAIRRVGGPYAERLSVLSDCGLLRTTAGVVESISGSRDGYPLLLRLEDGSGIEADFVIDAAGWGGMRRNNNLAAELLSAFEKMEVSPGGRGLRVSPDFMAEERILVFGPLLAGMNTAEHRLWHLESTANIYRLADPVASAFVKLVATL